MASDLIRVLAVDDNKDLTFIINKLFSQYADIVLIGAACNGIQALRMIQQHKVDIVLLDIIMPDMDGMEVLKQLQALDGEKPAVIMLSAIGSNDLIDRAMALGASGFLLKPVDAVTLIEKIRAIYKSRRNNGLVKIDIG